MLTLSMVPATSKYSDDDSGPMTAMVATGVRELVCQENFVVLVFLPVLVWSALLLTIGWVCLQVEVVYRIRHASNLVRLGRGQGCKEDDSRGGEHDVGLSSYSASGRLSTSVSYLVDIANKRARVSSYLLL